MSASVAAAASTVADLPARLPFLDARAKARAVAAVKAVEAQTCAELVVTVKKQVRSYPEVHLLFGVVFAYVALLFLLFYPLDFNTTLMPLDTFLAFSVGFGLSRILPPLQRLALPARKRRETVEQAAKAEVMTAEASTGGSRAVVATCAHLTRFSSMVLS